MQTTAPSSILTCSDRPPSPAKTPLAPPSLLDSPHHADFHPETNVLFAALLLGLQHLEAAQEVELAHHSMLEDMLEDWTGADSHALSGLRG